MYDGELFHSLNSNGKNLEVNIQVITLKDNLAHPYFSLVDISKDNVYPIGIAKMEVPYTEHISNYWIKYNDVVVISIDMPHYQHKNTNSLSYLESNNLNQRIVNDHYNYSFICKVSKFKQKGKKFIVYFEDIGWKFLQKVPKEFRDSYIANQYLDDAFQAICELLEVQFAYSIEDLHKYTFGADGYSIQKDGQTVEEVTTILSEWGTELEEEDPLDDPQYENNGFLDLLTQNGQTEDKNNDAKSISDPNLNDEGTEPTDNIDSKIDKYQEDFENKILDLFKGNTIYESNLSSSVLNYGNITITPKASSDTNINMTNVGDTALGNTTGDNNSTQEKTKTPLVNTKTAIGLQNVNIVGKSKTSLSYDQINRMTVKQAQTEMKKLNKYYYTTIVRLRARAAYGRKIGPYTDYSKYYY